MKTGTVLAFDCATSPASVALRVGDVIRRESIPHGEQAAQLVAAIDRLMREANLPYAALESIVTTTGPGSFTGLRIGLAALHGFALAHATPIRLLTSSEAVAWAIAQRADAPTEWVVALDAGKGEYFAQRFTRNGQHPIAASPITTHPAATLGDCPLPCFSNLYPPEHPRYISGPDAATLAHIAAHLPIAALSEAVPYYIRDADAKLPGK